jgi:hypothetical protein
MMVRQEQERRRKIEEARQAERRRIEEEKRERLAALEAERQRAAEAERARRLQMEVRGCLFWERISGESCFVFLFWRRKVCCAVIRKDKRLMGFGLFSFPATQTAVLRGGRQEERRLERERMREEREAALQREREEEARRRAAREEAEALARQRAEEERQRCDVAPCALPAGITIAWAPLVVSR